ncbi:hypothetical protein ACP4OV_010386 [Aristida adscensionis]
MAANKKLLLAVLCLALVSAAAAAGRPSAGLPPAACNELLPEVNSCASMIIGEYRKTKKLFTPECCNQLARSPLGCACVVRDIVKKETGAVDIQEPFCVHGSGCPGY